MLLHQASAQLYTEDEAMKKEMVFFLASFEDKNGTYRFRIYRRLYNALVT